jgi:hypothetical protein
LLSIRAHAPFPFWLPAKTKNPTAISGSGVEKSFRLVYNPAATLFFSRALCSDRLFSKQIISGLIRPRAVSRQYFLSAFSGETLINASKTRAERGQAEQNPEHSPRRRPSERGVKKNLKSKMIKLDIFSNYRRSAKAFYKSGGWRGSGKDDWESPISGDGLWEG